MIGHSLESDWTTDVTKLLTDTYKTECEKYEKNFEIFLRTYNNEVLLVISFLRSSDELIAPYTLFISTDVDPKSHNQKLFKSMLDIGGMMLDDLFHKLKRNSEDEEIFQVNWEEYEHGDLTAFLKLTRENVGLSIKAHQLLNQ